MRAIAAATAIQTIAIVDFTNPQHLSMCAAPRFSVGDLLAGVLGDLVSLFKGYSGEAASAVY